VTGLHGIACHPLLVEAKVKKMLERIEPAVDRCPRPAVLVLPFHKLVDLAKRDLGERHGHVGKEEAQINGITHDGMCRELPALQVGPKPVDGGLADVVHRLPPA
jgi:hypothetical protein